MSEGWRCWENAPKSPVGIKMIGLNVPCHIYKLLYGISERSAIAEKIESKVE